VPRGRQIRPPRPGRAHARDELAASYIVYCSPSRKRQHCSTQSRRQNKNTTVGSAALHRPNPAVSDSDPSVEVELCAVAVEPGAGHLRGDHAMCARACPKSGSHLAGAPGRAPRLAGDSVTRQASARWSLPRRPSRAASPPPPSSILAASPRTTELGPRCKRNHASAHPLLVPGSARSNRRRPRV